MAGLLPTVEFAMPGPLRDFLVARILSGEKTATTALRYEYDIPDKETGEYPALPSIGLQELVRDSSGAGVCVIETIFVEEKRFIEVPWAHVQAEGEAWKRGRKRIAIFGNLLSFKLQLVRIISPFQMRRFVC